MELTHSVQITYEKILHKLFDNGPDYVSPIQTKIAEMIAAGKTDGETYYKADHVTVIRNFTNYEAASEWILWINQYNESIHDVTIVDSKIIPEKFEYLTPVPQEAIDMRYTIAAQEAGSST